MIASKSLKQWLFGNKADGTIRTRHRVGRRNRRPLAEQLECRLVLATMVEYDGFTLKFTGDDAETVTLVDDVDGHEVVFTASNLQNPVVPAGELVTLDNASLLATPGSGYTTVLTYTNVPLTDLPGGGTGTGALANFTVTDGIVTAVSVAAGGAGYSVGDTLTVDAVHLGNQTPGTAVVLLVNSVTAGVIDAGGLGIQTAGAGYLAQKTYVGVPLTTDGAGIDATADITVTDGEVTAVVINNPGTGHAVGDILSANASFLGGISTTNFEIEVDSVTVSQFTQDGPNYRISNVSQIVVDRGDHETRLQIGSAWNYDIAVEFIGGSELDVLDLISAVPRNVLMTGFGGDGGYDGVNQTIAFTNLDAVDFNATLGGNNLTFELVSGSPIDFNYEIIGAGAGRLTGDGNILTFSGLDDPADDPVTLSVTDGAPNHASTLGYLTVVVDDLTPIASTISGADARSDGRMFLGFGDQSGADLDFTTPTEAFTLIDQSGGDGAINIGSSTATLGAVPIVNGGSEYAVGDILLVNGGVGNTQARIQVDSVDNLGVITAASVINGGSYAIFPTSPVSSSIGIKADTDETEGSGATFTLFSLFAPMATPALFVSSFESGDVINLNSNLLLGSATDPADLALLAGTINLNAASIDTTAGAAVGAVTLEGEVVLGASVTINTNDAGDGGDVTFTNGNNPASLNADDATNQDRTLTITAGDGNVTFDGPIGNAQALADLDVTGASIFLNNPTVNVNDQGGNVVRFEGAITLGANVTINSDGTADNSILFADDGFTTTIDSDGTPRELVVTAGAGTVTFEGDVGANGGALADLDVTAATINLTAASYIIDAAVAPAVITFTGSVVLKNDTVEIDTATADSSVLFTSTINADDAAGQDRTLDIDAGAGSVTFQGNIGAGGNGALADLDVTAATINFNSTTVRVDDGGGNEVVTFTGAAVLGANLTFDTDGASDNDITFDGTINADSASAQNRTLVVTAGSASATFNGPIGAEANGALADLDVTAESITLAGANIWVDDNDSAVATVVFAGDVILSGNVAIDTNKSTGIDSSVQFTGSINADTGAESLSISAGTGGLTFGGKVGTDMPLLDLEISSAQNVMFHDDVEVGQFLTQFAGTGTTTFMGSTEAVQKIGVTTNNIILATPSGRLEAGTFVDLNAANNIDLQAFTELVAGSAATLFYGTAHGDSVTLSGSFTAGTTASITGTNGISNTLIINYNTAVLDINSGSLVFNAGTGAGTNRLIANGSTGVDNFTLSGLVLGEVDNSDVNYSNVHIVQINAGSGDDTIEVSGGGSTSTAINGDAGNDTVTLSGGNNMIISGGADNDTFHLSGGTNITVNGDAGPGPAGNDVFNVNDAIQANLNGNDGHDTFTLIDALDGSITGGNGDDNIFLSTITESGSVTGSIDGGEGDDKLSYENYTPAADIFILATGTLDGHRGNGTGLDLGNTSAFNNINQLVGNNTDTVVEGLNATSTWTITGPNSGTYSSPGRTFSFSGATLLLGGTGADTFITTGDFVFAGKIDGGGGNDTIDYSSNTAGRIYTVDGSNKGNIAGNLFENVEHFKAGSGADSFKFVNDTAKVTGKLDGGGGSDTLDYTGRSLAVNVDLKLGTATNTAGLVLDGGNATIENVTGSSANDVIFGSDLANVLHGGLGGDDILSGLAGDDKLYSAGGAASRSILIGGDGADELSSDATSGGDILLGGKTTYEVNKTALTAILQEWNRTTSYDSRVARIQGTMGGGLNGSYKLNASTVSVNTAVDELFGNTSPSQKNWYILGVLSTLTGDHPSETETTI